MEEIAFKKDETPYLIFMCRKCQQFAYVKTTQKTKKCLRCGRTHQVSSLSEGEIVYGMTAAVDTVKKKQTELAVLEFRSSSDFVVATNNITRPKSRVNTLRNSDQEFDYKGKFNEMLMELSKLYGKFPKYMLEIMAENYGIPHSELCVLINEFKKNKILIVVKELDFYFKVVKK